MNKFSYQITFNRDMATDFFDHMAGLSPRVRSSLSIQLMMEAWEARKRSQNHVASFAQISSAPPPNKMSDTIFESDVSSLLSGQSNQ